MEACTPEFSCRLGDVVSILEAVAPFVLIPAAIAMTAAALMNRRRLAMVLMIITVLSLVVPLGVSLWWTLTLPPS